jgi:hypothetical protein
VLIMLLYLVSATGVASSTASSGGGQSALSEIATTTISLALTLLTFTFRMAGAGSALVGLWHTLLQVNDLSMRAKRVASEVGAGMAVRTASGTAMRTPSGMGLRVHSFTAFMRAASTSESVLQCPNSCTCPAPGAAALPSKPHTPQHDDDMHTCRAIPSCSEGAVAE